MSQTSATRASDTVLPPTLAAVTSVAGVNTNVTTVSTSNSAAATSLTSVLPTSPANAKLYITIAVITTDVYIAFKKGTAAATVTTSTGLHCTAGAQYSFWIIPSVVDNLEYITSSAGGTLQFYISSPPYEGT